MHMHYSEDKFYICVALFFTTTAVLLMFSNKLNAIQAFALLNANTLAWVYVQGHTVTLYDPDRMPGTLLAYFNLTDGVSNWLYVLSATNLSLTKNMRWSLFGKIAILLSLLTYFDDRQTLIYACFTTSVI